MKSKELTVGEFIQYKENGKLPDKYTEEEMQKILTKYSSEFEEIRERTQKMFSAIPKINYFPKFNYFPKINIAAIQNLQKIANPFPKEVFVNMKAISERMADLFPKELFANMKAISEKYANIFPRKLIVSANKISGIYPSKRIEFHSDESLSKSIGSQPILDRESITNYDPITEIEVESDSSVIEEWKMGELKAYVDEKFEEIEDLINSKATEMQWFFIFADNKVSLNKMEKYFENFLARLGEVNISKEKILDEFITFFQAFNIYYSKLELIDSGKFDKVKRYLKKISEMVFVEEAGKKIIKLALSLSILL